MFDRTAKLFTEYEHEIKIEKKREHFEKYSLECPQCGRQSLLPPLDYICSQCRELQASVPREDVPDVPRGPEASAVLPGL